MKKHFLFSIVFFLLTNNLSAQRDSEIEYQKCERYLQAKDSFKSEAFFLQFVDINQHTDSISWWQADACEELYKIYVARGQYRSALNYLDYPKNKGKRYRGLCQGGRGEYNRHIADYKHALCYYGLGEIDSCINALMPRIFKVSTDREIDSSGYDELETIARFFVKVLCEKYGPCKLKALFADAMAQMKYLDSITDNSATTSIWCTDFYFVFLDTKVSLYKGCNQYQKSDINTESTREYFLNDFRQNLAYIVLSGCDWEENCNESENL